MTKRSAKKGDTIQQAEVRRYRAMRGGRKAGEASEASEAANLYGRRRQRIGQTLMELHQALDAHEARFEAQGKTSYGHPGDLGRVLELLTEALAAVGGK